ncbi:hypothetical protein RHSIM_Rhsim13G0045900 [Rhododendron simsii]|uniref:Uncharacterized protein n=1 Tax=Rhododendron simsii TaxID=118357 RepID=A0A834G0W6_RHOSS|nr:hypothetical protein RHSIM_Rhsim13G0045900 [Rhododendron simsii]
MSCWVAIAGIPAKMYVSCLTFLLITSKDLMPILLMLTWGWKVSAEAMRVASYKGEWFTCKRRLNAP